MEGSPLPAFGCADSNFWTGDMTAHDDPFDIRNKYPLSAAEQQFRGYGVGFWSVLPMYTPSQTAEMQASIIAAFDLDKSGKLDRAELRRVLLETDIGFVRSADAPGWAAGGICPPSLVLASDAMYDEPTLGKTVQCLEADTHCRQIPVPVECGSEAMIFFSSSPCCRDPSASVMQFRKRLSHSTQPFVYAHGGIRTCVCLCICRLLRLLSCR